MIFPWKSPSGPLIVTTVAFAGVAVAGTAIIGAETAARSSDIEAKPLLISAPSSASRSGTDPSGRDRGKLVPWLSMRTALEVLAVIAIVVGLTLRFLAGRRLRRDTRREDSDE